jgi:hypothetical protein
MKSVLFLIFISLPLFAFLQPSKSNLYSTQQPKSKKQTLKHWGFARVSINIRATEIDHENQPFDSTSVKMRLLKAPIVAREVYYIAISTDKKGRFEYNKVSRSANDSYKETTSIGISASDDKQALLDNKRTYISIGIKGPQNMGCGVGFNLSLTQENKKIKITPAMSSNYQRMINISPKLDKNSLQRYILFSDLDIKLLPGEEFPFEHN